MPLALVIILLDIMLVWHAARTGRMQPWAFIILMVPVAGAVAYVLIELLPEIFGGRTAQQARRNVAKRIDPEKTYSGLVDQLASADTIANRAALATECLEIGRFDEAVQHYEHILNLPLGHEAGKQQRKQMVVGVAQDGQTAGLQTAGQVGQRHGPARRRAARAQQKPPVARAQVVVQV